MEMVANNRGLECQPAGCIAVEDCSRIGEYAMLISPTGARSGPHLIADCGVLLSPGRIAEVEWSIAERWGMRGPVACQVIPWHPRWYYILEESYEGIPWRRQGDPGGDRLAPV
jgi:hypothetical protein